MAVKLRDSHIPDNYKQFAHYWNEKRFEQTLKWLKEEVQNIDKSCNEEIKVEAFIPDLIQSVLVSSPGLYHYLSLKLKTNNSEVVADYLSEENGI